MKDQKVTFTGKDGRQQTYTISEISESSGPAWREVTIGGVGAIALGAAGVLLTSARNPDPQPEPEAEAEPHHNDNPLVDDNIGMASSVSDSMSFSQAFAAARAEVGPGGCFEWHGQIYGTYYANEWRAMTPADKAAFNDHFAWNHPGGHFDDTTPSGADGAQGNTMATAPADTTATPQEGHESAHVHIENHYHQYHNIYFDDDVAAQQPAADGEVQVLGVTHDFTSGANIAAASIDGEDVILVDVDSDQVFDYLAYDENHDGELQDSEIFDIDRAGITTDDLGGFTDGYDPMADTFDSCDDGFDPLI